MTVDEILKSLGCFTGEFPREALEAAVQQREAITPHLLEALCYVGENGAAVPDEYWLHTWAMYLLAQFRETRAYPHVVAALSFSREVNDKLHGELVTEAAAKVLASVSGGDTTHLKRLAEDPEVDEYAREAALRAMLILVVAGLRTREETLEYFQHLMHTGQGEPASYFWTGLVSSAAALYPDGLYEDIKSVYDRNLPDPFFISLENVNEILAKGEEAALAALRADCGNRFIENTVKETQWWACFQPEPVYEPAPEIILPSVASPRFLPGSFPGPAVQPGWSSPHPPASVGPKPGRNDRCPCGSGLKYKKCCLKK